MLAAGRLIAGRYRLERVLGTGGMGEVWIAKHLELDSPVAIKFQHTPLAKADADRERFQREGRVLAQLKSPYVVRIQDYGVDGDMAFMAMELLEGESLRARLDREGRVMPREASRVLRQAAAGLELAHARGVVHRDVKPSNLFLAHEGDGEVLKLLDFGIAKWTDVDAHSTNSSVIIGSAPYMSPEQARGQRVDRRTDVWSLGIVAYEMLVGEVPFAGANIPDTTMKICSGAFEVPSVRLGLAYGCFDEVFRQALALSADARPPSATALADLFAAAVAEWKESSAVTLGRESDTATMGATVTGQTSGRTRRRSRSWVGAVAFGVVGVAAVWSWRSGREPEVRLEPAEPAATSTTSSVTPPALSLPTPTPPAARDAIASAQAHVEVPKPASSTRASTRPAKRSPSSGDARPPANTAPAPKRSSDPDFGLTVPAR